jgi:hypothetical protein
MFGPAESCNFSTAWLTIALNKIEFDNQKVNLFKERETFNKKSKKIQYFGSLGR